MSVNIHPFGRLRDGASVTILDYGATVQALRVPDRSGGLRACLKSPRARLSGGFSAAEALRILEIHKGFLRIRAARALWVCSAKNLLENPHTPGF